MGKARASDLGETLVVFWMLPLSFLLLVKYSNLSTYKELRQKVGNALLSYLPGLCVGKPMNTRKMLSYNSDGGHINSWMVVPAVAGYTCAQESLYRDIGQDPPSSCYDGWFYSTDRTSD